MLPFLLACTDTRIDLEREETGGEADTAGVEDTAPPPRDLDEDGYDYTVDCLDLNADVHPGATEVWNGLDDDCDGVIDGDGDWTGEIAVTATAVYEGRPYEFALRCPFVGTRLADTFPWLVTCTPDANNADAQRLLGASFTLVPEEDAVEGAAWSGAVTVASSSGWDTDAEGEIAWANLDTARLTAGLSAFSLSLQATGTISRP